MGVYIFFKMVQNTAELQKEDDGKWANTFAGVFWLQKEGINHTGISPLDNSHPNTSIIGKYHGFRFTSSGCLINLS